MKVTVRRSGGFAGMTHQFILDSATLPPHDADELRRLVAAATAAVSRSAGPPQTDVFQYDVTVTDDSGRTNEHRWTENTLTDSARTLIATVVKPQT